jgi:hypothetical protein
MTDIKKDLISLASKGGNDAALFLLDKIHKAEKVLEDMQVKMDEMKQEHGAGLEKLGAEMPKMLEATRQEIPTEFGVEIKGAEVVTIKGEKGDTPTDDELTKLITPLIPPPEDGYSPVKGKDYFDGKDGRDGDDGIDGKDGYTPRKGIDYFDGKDGSPDTPEQIRDKLEKLEGDVRLDVSSVKGLEKYDKEIAVLKEGRPIFGPGKTKIYLKDLSVSLDGATKTFSIGTHFGISGVWSSSSPFAFRPTIDYNEVGRNIVFTDVVDAAISLATGQTLIVQYLK